MSTKPVTFVWPGDLHLETPDRPNNQVAQWMADEVNELIRPDFVQFAGDNVQHARDSEWDLFKNVTSKLKMPFYAVVGDHDAHHDPGCYSYKANVGARHSAQLQVLIGRSLARIAFALRLSGSNHQRRRVR